MESAEPITETWPLEHRLVALSNRVSKTHDASGGGLAVALSAAFADRGGLWFGWSGETIQGRPGKADVSTSGDVTFATIDLNEDDFKGYYVDFCNRAIWPLFHYRTDLTKFDRAGYAAYRKVNDQFAKGVAPLLHPTDLVWVHDYQMMMVGRGLRRLGVEQRLGFFLHIPFPAPDVLVTLPVHRDIVESLFSYDLVGFQTEQDVAAFCAYVTRFAGGIRLANNRIRAFDRTISVQAFPIGVDTETLAALAVKPAATEVARQLARSGEGRQFIIGADRLDYTKGLVERLSAFEELLRSRPSHRGLTTLLQITPHSRGEVPEYAALREKVETAAGRINGKFATFDWTPIRYLNDPYDHQELVALYRESRVGLVTPLRDGMNLVAKEYVAAQSPEDPGVLILSEFAGAARQLKSALLVNPHDIESVAEAIDVAFAMPLAERKQRWAEMMSVLRQSDLNHWYKSFLQALSATDRADGGSARPVPTVRPIKLERPPFHLVG